MHRALTIAGSDSGAGAGIQADLKTFAALGVYGCSVITAVTAQNTREVRASLTLPSEIVTAQIEAVIVDIGADAVKTGMLPTAAIVEAVAAAVRDFDLPLLVVDPVMVASTGQRLIDDNAVAAIRTELVPRALVVTPNAAEAGILTGIVVDGEARQREAARSLVDLGARAALVTGGDLGGDESVDVLVDRDGEQLFRSHRVPGSAHGSGCTFSAAIAAGLARGSTIGEAAHLAHAYVARALAGRLRIGSGSLVLDHLAHSV